MLRYASISGSRKAKLQQILEKDVLFETIHAASDHWLRGVERIPPTDDYLTWPRLDEIVRRFISGVQTKNDALFVDFVRNALARRMGAYLFERQQQPSFDEGKLRPYLVSPFDVRWIYYDPALLGRARFDVMKHLLYDNLALVFMRQSSQTGSYDHALVVNTLSSDRVFYSRRGAPFVAPLWLDPTRETANVSFAWQQAIAVCVGHVPTPEESFAYIYATLWSADYRKRFLVHLQRDFPRIPWPRDAEDFAHKVSVGLRLISLHVVEQACENGHESGCPFVVERGFPRWASDTLWLSHDAAIPYAQLAWDFHVGGYRVVERWLKARRGRALSASDVQHIKRFEHIALETDRFVRLIDE